MLIWCFPTKAGKCAIVKELIETKGRNPQTKIQTGLEVPFLYPLLSFGNGTGKILNEREHVEFFFLPIWRVSPEKSRTALCFLSVGTGEGTMALD